jgi:hypothetical protein
MNNGNKKFRTIQVLETTHKYLSEIAKIKEIGTNRTNVPLYEVVSELAENYKLKK